MVASSGSRDLASDRQRALALLFAGATRRPALAALYQIDDEIAATTRPGLEHAVAHARLGWWRGEIDRLVAARPQHPATRALLAAAPRGVDAALLHERLVAADLALAGFVPDSTRALDALLYRSHGALQQLAAQLCAGEGGGRDAALAEFGAALGRGLGLLAALRSRRPDARAAEGDPLAPPLIAARARETLASASQALAASSRPAQAHGCVLAALAGAELRRAAARGYAWPLPRSVPAAFADLWIAWRAARPAQVE